MPELPEVETILRSLQPIITGRQIIKVEILTPGVLVSEMDMPVGARIEKIRRRGKYLMLLTGRDGQAASLVIHLRMTGRLLLRTLEDTPVKHTHIRFHLSPAHPDENDAIWLDFVDPRRFGRIWLIDDPDRPGPGGLMRLGPEPLDPAFSPNGLLARLSGRKSSLKALLLDQTIVAGLGNIYADEALFAGGLNPTRPGSTLRPAEADRLVQAVQKVLLHAIACNGTTLRDYADGWNRRGSFQDCLMVYGRGGQPCRDCGETIRQTRLAGRTTCWCPVCQPEKPIDSEVKTP